MQTFTHHQSEKYRKNLLQNLKGKQPNQANLEKGIKMVGVLTD